MPQQQNVHDIFTHLALKSFLFSCSTHLSMKFVKCNVHTTNDIGDEYHYLFLLKFFKSAQKLYFV